MYAYNMAVKKEPEMLFSTHPFIDTKAVRESFLALSRDARALMAGRTSLPLGAVSDEAAKKVKIRYDMRQFRLHWDDFRDGKIGMFPSGAYSASGFYAEVTGHNYQFALYYRKERALIFGGVVSENGNDFPILVKVNYSSGRVGLSESETKAEKFLERLQRVRD